MKAKSDNSIITLRNCFGLHNDWLADAFVKKGAKAFIGWDEKVTLEHTDAASLVFA